MTTKTIQDKAETIKNTINSTAEKSNETLREIIITNNKYMGAAIDTNKKIIDSVKKQFSAYKIDDSVSDSVEKTFTKSMEFAEDSIGNIINSYIRQMKWNIDANTKLVDTLVGANGKDNEKVFDLILENFESSRQLTIDNTKEILGFYSEHTNLALNFNKKFEENINTLVKSFFALQSKSLVTFTNWPSTWWLRPTTEKAKVLSQN